MLELLSLGGCIVTADAPNCQRAVAAAVVAKGGDYVLALKGNQGSLHDDVRLSCRPPSVRPRWSMQERHNWPGQAAIGQVTRIRETAAKLTQEIACSVLSSALSAEHFGQVARAHWDLENSLHWVLDVTMNKDQARHRKDHGPQNLALLRRLALNVAKLENSQGAGEGQT